MRDCKVQKAIWSKQRDFKDLKTSMHTCQVSQITHRGIHILYMGGVHLKWTASPGSSIDIGDADTSTRPPISRFYPIHEEWIQNKKSLCKYGRRQAFKCNLSRTKLCKMKLMLDQKWVSGIGPNWTTVEWVVRISTHSTFLEIFET